MKTEHYILFGHLFHECTFKNSKLYGCVFENCEFINCDFSQANFINIKFNKCILSNCDFSNSSFQDTSFKETFKTKCNFSNINILDNVKGIENDIQKNIISETQNQQFIQTLQKLDLKSNVLTFDESNKFADFNFKNVNLSFVYDRETKSGDDDEKEDSLWRIMLLLNNENLLTSDVYASINLDQLKNILKSFKFAAIKKVPHNDDFLININNISNLFDFFDI